MATTVNRPPGFFRSRFKCNSLLYLNRGLPGSVVYDLSTVRQESRRPRYRVFKGKGSRIAAFSTNWKFLAEAYMHCRCKNYGRVEKLVSDHYETVLEWAYGIHPDYN